MVRKKPVSINIMRLCPHCGKLFGPMTEAQWQYVFRMHLIASLRQNPGLYDQVGNSEIH
jgi:hypothetical protein